jgi:hypothetical protein
MVAHAASQWRHIVRGGSGRRLTLCSRAAGGSVADMVRMPGGSDDEQVPGGRAAERREEHLRQRFGADEPAVAPEPTAPDEDDDCADEASEEGDPRPEQ